MPWWCRTCRIQIHDPEQHTRLTGHAGFDNALVDRHATALAAGDHDAAATVTAELETGRP